MPLQRPNHQIEHRVHPLSVVLPESELIQIAAHMLAADSKRQFDEEVVVHQKRVALWQLHQDALFDTLPQPTNLVIYTNQDGASFSVYSDDAAHKLLLRGRGRESDLSVSGASRISIEYDPIILTGNSPTVLLAPPALHVRLLGKKGGPVAIVGNYLPQLKPEDDHAH